MSKNYTVIKTASLDSVLYDKGSSIIMETISGDIITLAKNVNPSFSVSLTPKENLLLFYRDTLGNAYLSKLSPTGMSESKPLLDSPAFTNSNYCVYGQSNNLGACFFYTKPSDKKDTYILFATNFASTEDFKIDTIYPLNEQPFYFLYHNSPAVIYRSQYNMLILAVFDGKNLSSCKKHILSRRSDRVLDVSCVKHGDDIHIAYVMNHMDSCYVVYKSLKEGVLSPNHILHISVDITNCTMFISKSTLFVFIITKESTYYAFSKDFGQNFSSTTNYFKHVTNTQKAHFINSSTSLCAQETFVNHQKPLLIDNFLYCDTLEACSLDQKNLMKTISTLQKENKRLKKELSYL